MWLFWDQYKKVIALCVIPVIAVVALIGFEIKMGQGNNSKPLTANQEMKGLLQEQKDGVQATDAHKAGVDTPNGVNSSKAVNSSKVDDSSDVTVTPNVIIPPKAMELPAESSQVKPSTKPKKTPKPASATSKTASNSARISNIIHLNTANSAELMELSGIGESKAKAIIAYRQAHPFQTLDELMNVKGIGPKIFAKIKDHLEL